MPRPRPSPLVLFAAYLAACLILQLTTLLVRPAEDSAAWLFMGQRQEAGQMPGRDLWDNKLPLIYLVGRAAMRSGRPELFLWLLESALTAVAALAVAGLTARLTGRGAAIAAGALLCVLSGVPSYRGEGFAAEVYSLSAASVAAYLTLRPIRGEAGFWGDAAAGLLWLLSASFRLPTAGVAVLVVCAAAWARRVRTNEPEAPAREGLTEPEAPAREGPTEPEAPAREGPTEPEAPARGIVSAADSHLHGDALASASGSVGVAQRGPEGLIGVLRAPDSPVGTAQRCLAAHALGALAGVAIVFAHPLAAGYARECVEAAVLWPLGLSGRHVAGPLTPARSAHLAGVAGDLAKLSWLHAAALAGLIIAGRRSLAATIPVATWYVSALLTTAVGWTSFAHYHYVTFAPASVGFGLLAGGVRGRWRLAPLAVGVAGLALAITQNVRVHTRRAGRSDDPEKAALLAYLSVSSGRQESLLLWVWGRDADLLYRLDRPPGVRHFLAHSYFDMDMTLFDEFVAEIAANPPEWIVQGDRPGIPRLLRAGEGRGPDALPALQVLRTALSPRFAMELKCGRFEVWRKRDGAEKGRGTGLAPSPMRGYHLPW